MITRALVLLVLHVAAGESPAEKHSRELKEHFHHLNYIAQFPCHTPQPRAIAVENLFGVDSVKDKAFFPDVTVLHRCSDCTSAGYCTEGKRCGPLHVEQIKLPFKITFLTGTEGHKVGSWILDYYEVHNHTECGCTDSPAVPPQHHPPPHPQPQDNHPVGVDHTYPGYGEQTVDLYTPPGPPIGSPWQTGQPEQPEQPTYHQPEQPEQPTFQQPEEPDQPTFQQPEEPDQPTYQQPEEPDQPTYHQPEQPEQPTFQQPEQTEKPGDEEKQQGVLPQYIPKTPQPESPSETQFGGQSGSNQFGGQQGSSQFGGQQGSNQFSGQQGSTQFGGQSGSNQFGGQQESNQFGGQQGSNQFSGQQGSTQFGGQSGSSQFGTGQLEYVGQSRPDQFGRPPGYQPEQKAPGSNEVDSAEPEYAILVHHYLEGGNSVPVGLPVGVQYPGLPPMFFRPHRPAAPHVRQVHAQEHTVPREYIRHGLPSTPQSIDC